MDAMARTNLEILLFEKGMNTKRYSEALGISERACNNKIRKRTQFTFKEVKKTGEMFPDHTLEYIFDGYGQREK